MLKKGMKREATDDALPKAATGIAGLDEVTAGGLPRGRPTLVCGSAGCGKTLFGMQFLVSGALRYGEPGVFMAFEESAEDLAQNVRSLGFDLPALVAQDKLRIDHVRIEPSEIQEAGEYDLEALFLRLGYAIDSIGAKRVVIDTLETIFGGLNDEGILRAELRRLFQWLKDRGVTAVITAERGDGTLTRQGLEEYVSDCVIVLDHRITEQVSTRRLRIVKYRGSIHGTNEYPFLIDEEGLSVLPVTSMGLRHEASSERIPTGIPQLDDMLGGGYYRGSSILLSGTSGVGKTSIAARFAQVTCARGERCLYLAFEESPSQIIRNMRSIGIDLQPAVEQGRLRIEATRPFAYGIEMHLVRIHKIVRAFAPAVLIVDPISNLTGAGSALESSSMLVRLIDFLKGQGITALLTNLTAAGGSLETTASGVSSLIDTWILLRDIELNGERNRGIYVLKSRGMAHSNQIRELLLTNQGIRLADVYLGPEGVLTGSARLAQEQREVAASTVRRREIERKREEIEGMRREMEAKITALQVEFEAKERELKALIRDGLEREARVSDDRVEMARQRRARVETENGGERGNVEGI